MFIASETDAAVLTARERHQAGRGRAVRWCAAAILGCLVGATGCAELVADGHVSDRDTGSPVPDVEILRAKGDAQFRRIATTDPRGKYWILKAEIPSGSIIRLRKPGYHDLEMTDARFLGSKSHIIVPTSQTPEDFESRGDEE